MQNRALIESARGDVSSIISRMLAELRISDYVRSDTRVALKPNFTYPFHKEGVTTSPIVLRGLVAALRDYTRHIAIVESDGGSHAWRAETSFESHGVMDLIEQFDVRAVNLSRSPTLWASNTVAGTEIRMELPAILLEETDFFITVPVPKVHAMTGISLGLKNQWGCIPDVKRLRHHPDFRHKIVAINRLLRTRMAVFDGTWFLDGNGPMNGNPVRRDLLIAGELGVATYAVCQIMGVDPHTISHKRLAIAEGLLPSELKEDQVNRSPKSLCYPVHLRRSPLQWASLAVFHSATATNLLYNSRLAKPAHDLLYLLRGRSKDIQPIW